MRMVLGGRKGSKLNYTLVAKDDGKKILNPSYRRQTHDGDILGVIFLKTSVGTLGLVLIFVEFGFQLLL